MKLLPFQPEIAERMLIGTQGETIDPESVFVHTANGYWLAWHNGKAALLAADTPPDIPCFWVEGAESLEELAAMIENGEFDEVEEFDGDDEAWQEAVSGCSGEHGESCGCDAH
ncbi:general secretion pathway protein GspG [Neisseria sp. ZJ106]|uniref:General secretion pathway protein GspG n=1 Tax=Neisseria lisongii TaxID=2912188 RepID=A0ABY7RKE8_9NEIS|nr:general secretion pathway protein GspG [Neisseria lisongii]MCF7520793.1 general secretion pathway protein GspG [Neisseria lisongii]WCL70730.1 general secretion pathway protein GspG [Neisseria lisongii]